MTAATPGREEISAIIAEWFPGKQSFRDRCADDILARLAAKPADEGWQDISTAPRDGTRVLATGGGLGNEIEIVNYNERVNCWDAQNDTLDDRDDEPQGYNRPTLWQPLPAPSSTTVAPKLDPPDNSLTEPSTMGEVE